MKRFALTWLCCSFLAGTASAQNARYNSGSSPVILRGVSSSDSGIPAAPISSYPTGSTSATTDPATSYFTNSTTSTTKPEDVTDGGELAKCGKCGQEWTTCCCPTGCGLTIFAEWMLLQPRGADVVFAARALDCFNPPLDTSQIDFGSFDSYRVGFSKTVHDGCSEIGASFWNFDAHEEEHAPRTTGDDVLLPLLLHPSQITCPGSTSTLARASAGI